MARVWHHPITQLLARIVFFALVWIAFGYLLYLLIKLPEYHGEAAMRRELSETGATPWLRQLRSLAERNGFPVRDRRLYA